MNYKLRPIGHRLLIEERIYEPKSKGGIIVASEKSQEEYQCAQTEGKIIAMGSQVFDFLPEEERPSLGDIVYYQKYDGYGKKYANTNYRLLIDENVFAVSKNYIDYDEELKNG